MKIKKFNKNKFSKLYFTEKLKLNKLLNFKEASLIKTYQLFLGQIYCQTLEDHFF